MLHIPRTKEAHFHPLSPPPDLPTDLSVKEQLSFIDYEPGKNENSDDQTGVVINELHEAVELQEDRENAAEDEERDGAIKSSMKDAANTFKQLRKTPQTLGFLSLGTQFDLRRPGPEA